MPTESVTLPDIEQSVARPAVFQVLKQLFNIIGLSSDTKVIYKGHSDIQQTPGTSIDNQNKDAKFAAERYTFVEVDENYLPWALQETSTHQLDHKAVFHDRALGVILSPIYTTSEVAVQVKYRSVSQTEVSRWLSGMVIKLAQGREYNLHVIDYSYPIAYPFLRLIEDIYTLREKNYGYSEDFQEYFVKNSAPQLTILADRAGENRHLSIKERQSRIIGRIDVDSIPDKPTKDSSNGVWEISFTYKFTYQRPDGLRISYPVAVHQSLLPSKYQLLEENIEDPDVRQTRRSSTYEALEPFEIQQAGMDSRPLHPYIKLPYFDDFVLPAVKQGTSTVFTALCLLGPDRKTLLDLHDLDTHQIDEALLPYMVEEAPYMTSYLKSLFYINVYEDGNELLGERFEVTPDLIVRSKEELDPRKLYRVRFALFTDISPVVWKSVERLRKYPESFVVMLSSLNEILRINPDFHALRARGSISKWELEYAYWILTGALPPGTRGEAGYTNLFNQERPTRQNLGQFLGSVDPEVVRDYLSRKASRIYTTMTTVITPRKLEDLGQPTEPS